MRGNNRYKLVEITSVFSNSSKETMMNLLKLVLKDTFFPKTTLLPKDYQDLTGKVALVTGASGGVGRELAKLLAMRNCLVIIGVRDRLKAERAVETIKKEIGDNNGEPVGEFKIVVFDLADLTSIRSGVEQIEAVTNKLNIIIHNAGVMMPPKGSKTVQGYELQLGTNVIGPYLLQKLLDPLFLKDNTSFKRIVWVSSFGHNFAPEGGINWEDINFEKGGSSFKAYAQSKAGNSILAGIWPQHHIAEVEAQNIISTSVHPGFLKSELQRHQSYIVALIERLMSYHSVYGAYTELFALLSPSLTIKDNGDYFVPWGIKAELRPDVQKSISDGNGENFWKWLDNQVESY